MNISPELESATSPIRSRIWDWIVVGALFCITLAMTYPLPARLTTHLAGDDYDVWGRPWVTWWTKTAMREGHSLYWTDDLFYPRGVSLVFHSFSHTNSAIALLVEPLVGWIAAHNITVLLAYFLSGVGMYFLAKDLTHSRRAGFLSALVYAFSTYHIDQSSHVILVTIQWIPLWILALIRLFREERPFRHAFYAAIFLALTALSSWHLFLFCGIWFLLYAVYLVIWKRDRLSRDRLLALVLMGCVTVLVIGPFFFPLVEGLVGGGVDEGVTVPYQGENAIDVLAFFVPSRRHPLLGTLHGAIGRRQVFLGYVPLALAFVGALKGGRRARFWVVSTLAFFVTSLGAYIRFNGVLSERPWQPWLIPLIEFIRDPTRLTVMTTLGLALLVGFGVAWLLRRLRGGKAVAVVVILGALVLFEYLPWPFPTSPVVLSSFYDQMRESSDDFAIADIPIRHLEGRRLYMFYQIAHQHPIIEGIVARTPSDAYAFIDRHPILSAFTGDAGPTGGDVSRQLGSLAESDVRYLVLHRRLLSAEQVWQWQDYLPFDPYFQDDIVIVYRTDPRIGEDLRVELPLTDDVGLARLQIENRYIAPGGEVSLRTAWIATRRPADDYRVEWALIDSAGEIASRVEGDLCSGWPVEAWSAGDFCWNDYALEADLAPGPYRLQAWLVGDEGRVRGRDVGSVLVLSPEVNVFEDTSAGALAVFDDRIALLALDVIPGDQMVHIRVDWAALQALAADYKVFVHLFDADGDLVAQSDAMPRDWSAPTSSWEPRHVVSDLVSLDTYGLPAGDYDIAVGLYDPATLDRLPVSSIDGVEAEETSVWFEMTLPNRAIHQGQHLE